MFCAHVSVPIQLLFSTLLSLNGPAESRPASQPGSVAQTRPSVEHLVNMILELDTWHQLRLDPDNSEGGWTRLLETAIYFQTLEPESIRKAMKWLTRDPLVIESGPGGLYDATKSILLIRAMFDVPEDLLVPEEYPPEPWWDGGGYIMQAVSVDGADHVFRTLAMPLTWTNQGPSFICELDGFQGAWPRPVHKEFRYFQQHFGYRNLTPHLKSLRQPRPVLTGELVSVYRQSAEQDDPELVYEFSENDGVGYEQVELKTGYRNFAPIHVAAQRGDLQVLKQELAKGVPIDLRVMNSGGAGWWRDTTPLMWAALEGSAESVKLLLDSGADVNARSDDGVTPLMFAAQAKPRVPDDTPVRMKLLLDAGADVSARDRDAQTALEHLRSGEPGDSPGDVDRLYLLLHSGLNIHEPNDDGITPFFHAMADKGPEVIEALLKTGGEVNSRSSGGWSPLLNAATYNSAEVVRVLVKAGAEVNWSAEAPCGGSVLVRAVRSHREPLEKTSILLTAGARVNAVSNGSTALIAAAEGDSIEVVRMLLDAGAEVDAGRSDGYTALIAATDREPTFPRHLGLEYHPAIVELLIRRGADPGVTTSKGRTALMGAARAGDLEGVRLLLQKGASAMPRDYQGRTALIEAAASALADGRLVVELIKAGAGVDRADDMQMTPLMHAAAREHIPSTVKALLDAGAGTELRNADGKTARELIQGTQTARARRILRMLEQAARK